MTTTLGFIDRDIPETVPFLFEVDAKLTTLARHYLSRGTTDGTSVRVTDYELGSGGVNPFNPDLIIPASSSAINLHSPTGPIDVVDRFEWANNEALSYLCTPGSFEGNVSEILLRAEIMNSPVPGEDGTIITYAIGHFPQKFVNPAMETAFRVVVQY